MILPFLHLQCYHNTDLAKLHIFYVKLICMISIVTRNCRMVRNMSDTKATHYIFSMFFATKTLWLTECINHVLYSNIGRSQLQVINHKKLKVTNGLEATYPRLVNTSYYNLAINNVLFSNISKCTCSVYICCFTGCIAFLNDWALPVLVTVSPQCKCYRINLRSTSPNRGLARSSAWKLQPAEGSVENRKKKHDEMPTVT